MALPGVALSSYCPFVDLAVARYQRDSIAGLELSPVVRTELVQVLPERTLTVRRAGTQVRVLLEGLGPGGPVANRVDVILEQCKPPRGMMAASVDLTAVGPVQDGVVAWTTVPGGAHQTALNAAVELSLPSQSLAAFRIRVREVEFIGGPEAAATATPQELSERVVFTDVVMAPG